MSHQPKGVTVITVEQLRNTARFGSSLSDQAILEIADRLEQLEREVETLKNKQWPADVSYVLSDKPLPAITIDNIFPTLVSNNPQDVDYSQINKYDTKC